MDINNQQTNNFTSTVLPMAAMKEIPTANANAAEITALVKEGGKVMGYQLSSGQVVGKDQGIAMARQGGIAGVGISEKNGNEYLKSLPDGSESNNLGSLPSVSMGNLPPQ